MSTRSLQRNDYEYHITCPQNYDFFRSFVIMLEFSFLAIQYEKFSYQSVSNNNQGGTPDLKCLSIYTPRLQRIGQEAPQ